MGVHAEIVRPSGVDRVCSVGFGSLLLSFHGGLAIDFSGCNILADTGSYRFRVGSTLGMPMKNQTIIFDDEMGRSLVIYRTGIFAWSYSVNGKPAGKTFLTRVEHSSRQKSWLLCLDWCQKNQSSIDFLGGFGHVTRGRTPLYR